MLAPEEYAQTVPFHVDFDEPEKAPGIVPNAIKNPNDAADLSYTIYALSRL